MMTAGVSAMNERSGADASGQRALSAYAVKRLAVHPDAVAPDGSAVRVLAATGRGSVAHFELGPGQTSVAVAHRTVEEIWFFVRGSGEMWRRLGAHEEVAAVETGVSLAIPAGTHFQFRSFGPEPLAAVGVTMPPWPGAGEAYVVEGRWAATVPPGPA